MTELVQLLERLLVNILVTLAIFGAVAGVVVGFWFLHSVVDHIREFKKRRSVYRSEKRT